VASDAPAAEATVTAPRQPLAFRFVRGRFFYGWLIVGGCLVMQFVTVGVGYYGQSIFLKPLRDEHGWSASIVSSASGMYFIVSGLSAFAVGPFLDRVGPRRFMLTGALLTGVAAVALGHIDRPWQLFACYAVMAVAFGIGAGVAVSSLLTKWFIDNRARAVSIASTGVSLGGAVLVPVGSALIGRGGLALAAPVLGIAVVVVAVPILLAVVSPTPQALGLHPDGRDAEQAGLRARTTAAGQYQHWTRTQAARTVPFWALVVGFALALAAQTGVLIHQLAFLQGETRLGSRSAAALAVTVTTIGSIVARLIVGSFADRAPKVPLTVGFMVLQGLCITVYSFAHATPLLYGAALVFGTTVGNVYMLQSLVTGERFGLVSFGAIYGVISLSGSVGSGIGLLFTGWAVDRFDGYDVPFRVLAVVNLLAAACVAMAARPLPVRTPPEG
jgi:sugar phosphate permease